MEQIYTSIKTFYIISGEYGYRDWDKSTCPTDPPLDTKGISYAKKLKISSVDTIIVEPNDRMTMMAAIYSQNNKQNFTTDVDLRPKSSQSCICRYGSWRLMKGYDEKDSIFINTRSIPMTNIFRNPGNTIALFVSADVAKELLSSLGADTKYLDYDIVKVTIQNKTGIPFYEFELIDESQYRENKIENVYRCEGRTEEDIIMDIDVVRGTKIKYTIPETKAVELNEIVRYTKTSLAYERQIWESLFRDLNIFQDGVISNDNGVSYWGRFPLSKSSQCVYIGNEFINFIYNFWDI